EHGAAGGSQWAGHHRLGTGRGERDFRRNRQEDARTAVRPYVGRVSRPTFHPATPQPRVGVLLINLGTPDAPHAAAVRRYLAEFLSDPRVIEIPKFAWKPILHGIILRSR